MKTIEFLSYVETPEEKYMGIATVLYDGAIMLRYKVQQSKEGSGFYVSAPSFKDVVNDEWLEWHSIDSKSQTAAINTVIRNHVHECMELKKNVKPKTETQKSAPDNPWGNSDQMGF